VRCSWCERSLDRYVEATLAPRAMADVAKHLAGCPNCTALLVELRVVDALLETTKPLELPINFTFAVMADVRTLAQPRVARFAWWAVTVTYLALAWLVGLGVALDTNDVSRAALAQTFAPIAANWHAVLNAVGGTSHALGSGAPIATGAGIVVLFADALALGAVFYFYRTLRPRLAAQLARVTETS